ncbi:MAG: aminotransferase class I/II-fold pyridoxal phosphate-dependent enzyme, partial [Gemmatimonadaceae bacterium]
QCEGLVDAIAEARGLPSESIVVGAGSSDLVFRALTRWLTPQSSVLLLGPTYGEYQHLLDHVVGCRVDRFVLDSHDDYQVDLTLLGRRIATTRPDLVIVVNPNNPTGQHIPRAEFEALVDRSPASTRFWIDEAYLDYIGADESLERFAATSANVVVCKSMSKVYALSGARAAYLTTARAVAAELRRVTPPWVVGLVAQLAAVTALRDPLYYSARYDETHLLRDGLSQGLRDLGLTVLPGRANSVLCTVGDDAPTVAEIVREARARRLFIRDITSMTTQPSGRVFRVAVKDAVSNAAICRILAEVLG